MAATRTVRDLPHLKVIPYILFIVVRNMSYSTTHSSTI